LLPFLVGYLHRVEANPPMIAGPVVGIVSSIMRDKVVDILAEVYVQKATYDDIKSQPEVDEDEEETESDKGDEADDLAATESETAAEESARETPEEGRANRVLMLRHFLEIVDHRIKRGAASR
jgi:hypothetical protein